MAIKLSISEALRLRRKLYDIMAAHEIPFTPRKDRNVLVAQAISAHGLKANERSVAEFFTRVDKSSKRTPKESHPTTNVGFHEASFSEGHFDSLKSFIDLSNRDQITWQETFNLELQAKQLLCITSDLDWASKIIHPIINNHQENHSDCDYSEPHDTTYLTGRYLYLVTSQSTKALVNKRKIDTFLKSRDLLESNIVQIRFLSNVPHFKNDFFKELPNLIPLPNDLVIYLDVPFDNQVTNIALTSVKPTSPYNTMDPKVKQSNYDIILSAQRRDEIMAWFSIVWPVANQ